MSYVHCPTCDKRIVDKRRYPVEPLCSWLGMSLSQACLTVGLSGSTQKAARCHGLSRQSVDTVSAKLRVHPSEIWPEVVDHDIEDHQVECAADNCTVRFMPAYPWQKFCSTRCRRRTEIQRERATAAGKARNNRQSAAWRESCPDYIKRYRANYWEANRERINAERRQQRRAS